MESRMKLGALQHFISPARGRWSGTAVDSKPLPRYIIVCAMAVIFLIMLKIVTLHHIVDVTARHDPR